MHGGGVEVGRLRGGLWLLVNGWGGGGAEGENISCIVGGSGGMGGEMGWQACVMNWGNIGLIKLFQLINIRVTRVCRHQFCWLWESFM